MSTSHDSISHCHAHARVVIGSTADSPPTGCCLSLSRRLYNDSIGTSMLFFNPPSSAQDLDSEASETALINSLHCWERSTRNMIAPGRKSIIVATGLLGSARFKTSLERLDYLEGGLTLILSSSLSPPYPHRYPKKLIPPSCFCPVT